MNQLIDNGYFKVGEIFYHKNGEQATLVDNKGKLSYKNIIDSMHEIAGIMMSKQRRVNAFEYFSVLRNNKLISIAEIREEYRKANNLSTKKQL
ncbi:hypothetical protein ACJA23_03380 [Mycoplasma corogypsi]|uniref:hypothetical protein n=1 Tax=Mycoplasma corogypsi TaxID=2106 RepID=UPI0038739EE5